MKVAITGASGHIGNCLVRKLLKKGVTVRVLVFKRESNLEKLDVELVQGNILNPDSLKLLCAGADVVFHLAARIAVDNRSAELVHKTNVCGTKNMLAAAQNAGVKKFIHFSSIHAFKTDLALNVLNENSPVVDIKKGIYEYSKAESEKLVMEATREGLNAVILCPTAVIGPYDSRGSLLGQALLKIYTNKLPALVAGGYNWVDVRDVASAAIESIENGRSGEKYILSGHYCDLKELSEEIGKISKSKTPSIIVPIYLARITTPFLAIYSFLTKTTPLYTAQSLGIIENSPQNISNIKAQKDLAYQPRPLTQTLIDTFLWYKQNNYLN